MNIALIGCGGAGKTTVSRLLAKKLDKKLISTDEEIVKRTRQKIPAFVKKHGWDKFRDIESEVVEYMSNFDDCIFDTSRGIILRDDNITNLKKNALIILLTSDTKTMASRLKSSKEHHGSIKTDNPDESERTFEEHEFKYKKASDYAIDSAILSPEDICDLIIHYFNAELK